MQTASQVTLDMLKVRTPDGDWGPIGKEPFCYYQKAYEAKAGRRNIIWKSRQMGFTTYSLAKGFLAACQGKEVISVVNRPEQAEHLFETIKGFVECLPDDFPITHFSTSQLAFGAGDRRSRYNFQIFSSSMHSVGCGKMIDFVHFGDFAWWKPSDQYRNMQAVTPTMNPDSEMIIESTPMEQAGMFRDIWDKAESIGFVRHFFPWWIDVRKSRAAVNAKSLSKSEKKLVAQHGLSLGQIGWRRQRMEESGMPEIQFKAEFGETEG